MVPASEVLIACPCIQERKKLGKASSLSTYMHALKPKTLCHPIEGTTTGILLVQGEMIGNVGSRTAGGEAGWFGFV